MKSIRLFSMAMLCMAMVLVSCSGEDGEQGLQGKEGPQGPQGEQGDQGEQGEPGKDNPAKDFYFQNGYKGYEGTQDAQISDVGGSTNNGILNIIDDVDNPGDERLSLIRFDGIADKVNNEYGSDNTSCGDKYSVNQAILYLYCTQTLGNLAPGYIHLGFYGPQDPLFDEESVTWSMANATDPWFIPGARSELFEGPFPGTDNYTAGMGLIGDSSSNIGWIAVHLPRDVVMRWICDESERNKGIRLRLSTDADGGTTTMRFMSSESDKPDLRPLLVIQTEELDADTSAKSAMNNTKPKDWESLTYEERMAPLYEFLSKK
ncbi:hypothetical protein GO009_00640 [Muricauda sp. TY007]|uniref:collagen-like protein n=1 Tax=Allomuricauda sp. TY007 TaxID=2683200 RepID=UPI0013C15216|nr:collagen-like protein [Muricauda sp. TY007]NDV14517.1 hypothetical protein [Muricauda sp. TY007]